MAIINLGEYKGDNIVGHKWYNAVKVVRDAIEDAVTSIFTLGIKVGTDGITWGTDSSGDIGASTVRPANIFADSMNTAALVWQADSTGDIAIF